MERLIEWDGRCQLDARFFYIDADGKGRATSDFVRHVDSRYIRNIGGTDFLFSPNYATTDSLCDSNPSILGYQVESMVLSHIAQCGLGEAGDKFDKIDQVYFFGGKDPDIPLKTETALYIPTAFNYKAVDGILVHCGPTETGRTKATIVGLQITISDQHKNTAPSWLSSVRNWAISHSVDEVKFIFCWIMENVNHCKHQTKEAVDMKVRAGKVVCPEHDCLRVKIGTLNQTIAERLRIAPLASTRYGRC